MTRGKSLELRVFADYDMLSFAAADEFMSVVTASGAGAGGIAVALSGGTTPRKLYGLLASDPYRRKIDPRKLHLFWADERCVPPGHRESNYGQVNEKLAVPIGLSAGNVHRIRGEDGPVQAARAYETELRSFFGTASLPSFDLIVLGIGEDGHTASLFPDDPSLHEKMRLAIPVSCKPPKLSRVTLSLPVLNSAKKVVFLASGRSKAAVIHEIIEAGNPKQYPAGLVRPERGTILWMVDASAGFLLKPSSVSG